MYMFARYARDLFAFRHFLLDEKKDIDSLKKIITDSAHTKLLDYIFKYVGIITQIKNGGCYAKVGVLNMG